MLFYPPRRKKKQKKGAKGRNDRGEEEEYMSHDINVFWREHGKAIIYLS